MAPSRRSSFGSRSPTAGCDKLFTTCRDRFQNAVNFRGFPHMPGNAFVTAIASPGNPANNGAPIYTT